MEEDLVALLEQRFGISVNVPPELARLPGRWRLNQA